jgi:hypothetical protein
MSSDPAAEKAPQFMLRQTASAAAARNGHTGAQEREAVLARLPY